MVKTFCHFLISLFLISAHCMSQFFMVLVLYDWQEIKIQLLLLCLVCIALSSFWGIDDFKLQNLLWLQKCKCFQLPFSQHVCSTSTLFWCQQSWSWYQSYKPYFDSRSVNTYIFHFRSIAVLPALYFNRSWLDFGATILKLISKLQNPLWLQKCKCFQLPFPQHVFLISTLFKQIMTSLWCSSLELT